MDFWQENHDSGVYQVPNDVLDISFKMDCHDLPLDHAHLLSQAVLDQAPFLAQTPKAALHLIHGAESGNGWQRPQWQDEARLIVSRRHRFRLRLPKQAVAACHEALDKRCLSVGEQNIRLSQPKQHPLTPQSTVFCRYIKADCHETETDFLHRIAQEIADKFGIRITKMLSGQNHHFHHPDGPIHTRSLLISDLEKNDSITLQQNGIGSGHMLGLGLVLPHKGIAAITAAQEAVAQSLE